MFKNQQADFDYLVRHASELLGAPGRGVGVDPVLDELLMEAGVAEARRGVEHPQPTHLFHSGRRGHAVIVGLTRYRIVCEGQTILAVRVTNGFDSKLPANLQDPWVVAERDYVRFYQVLRRMQRRQDNKQKCPPPIMVEQDQRRLYDNTIGFLTCGKDLLKRYGIPQKRGVLMLGPPGNGKTMACRWLKSECLRLSLAWRHVEVDAYENAREQHCARELFKLFCTGIVLLDDFDFGFRDRQQVGPTPLHSTLLSALDGVEQNEGVVYLFATNAKLAEIDPAFLRRGRIDQIIHFTPPTAEQRRRLIVEHWHADVVGAIDVDAIVARSGGRTFAELTELKKLLVLGYHDTGKWDWPAAWELFVRNDDSGEKRPRIGFGDVAWRRACARAG